MSAEHKHEKVVTSTPQADGTVKIITNSYYEELAHTMEETEKQVLVSKQTILKELIDCLKAITRDGSPEITIRIKAKHNEPVIMVKRWVTHKESFNRQ